MANNINPEKNLQTEFKTTAEQYAYHKQIHNATEFYISKLSGTMGNTPSESQSISTAIKQNAERVKTIFIDYWYSESAQSTVDLTDGSDRPQRLVHQIQISEKWEGGWKKELERLNQKLEQCEETMQKIISAQYTESGELNPKMLEKEFLRAEEEFERLLLEATSKRIAILEDIILLMPKDQPDEEIEQLKTSIENEREKLTNIKEKLQNVRNQLKPLIAGETRSIPIPGGNGDIIEVPADTFQQTWQYEEWAQNLINFNGQAEWIINPLKTSFEDNVNFIRREIEVIEEIEEKKLTEKDRTNLNELQRRLNQLYLQRTIDVLGSLNRALKKKSITGRERELINKKIVSLNTFFDQNLLEYRVDCMSKATPDILKNIWETFKSEISLGYLAEDFITPEEFERSKKYADMGYLMTENVKDWLGSLKFQKGEQTFTDVIKREVVNFLKWAETHPQAADGLAADIRLTVDLINDKSFTDAFIQNMQTRALTHAFLGTMHAGGHVELVEASDQLKYKALADLCKYLPITTAAVRNTYDQISVGNFSFTQSFISTAKTVLKTKALQSTQKIISKENTSVATSIAQIFRGDDIKQIITKRSEIEMVRIGGLAKDLLLHPTKTVERIKREAKIWWKSLFRSKTGTERAARIGIQVVLPALSIVGASAIITIGVVFSAVTFGASLGAAGAILTMTAGLYRRLYRMIDMRWPDTRKEIESKLDDNLKEKNIEILKKDKKMKKKISGETDDFIDSLKKRHLILNLKKIETSDLRNNDSAITEEDEQKINDIRNDLITETTNLLGKSANQNLMEVVNHFNKKAVYQNLYNKAHEVTALSEFEPTVKDAIAEKIARDVINNLIKNWLKDNIENIFFEQAASLYLVYQGNEQNYVEDELQGNEHKEIIEDKSDKKLTKFIKGKIEKEINNAPEIKPEIKKAAIDLAA